MSARALSQLAVVVLALVAAALAAVLVMRDPGAKVEPGPAVTCDLGATPPALSPATQDTVLVTFTEGEAKLTLDGKSLISPAEDPSSYATGAHTLRVECPKGPGEQPIDLRPFAPASVYASCSALYVFGALCDGCPQEDAARRAAVKAGKNSLLYAAATEQERLATAQRSSASQLLTRRWNALTERYSRMLGAVGREAPGAVAKANLRFEELSSGFKAATAGADPTAQDQLIRAAEETLAVFVKAARNAKPQDCGFQKRLTDSF